MTPTPCFYPATILLPDFSVTNGTRWSCVACDQYTSEPAYWEAADNLVGESPSTLRLILPEVYLKEAGQRTPDIHAAMETYLRDVLKTHPDCMILVRRTLADGGVRWGLVGLVDLEAYDYRRGAESLIRATEQTVAERIPARMTIRRDAALELPHVMLLMDDRDRTVIEPLTAMADTLSVAYDHDLMANSGHVKGYFLDDRMQGRILTAMQALITPEAMEKRYGKAGLAPLLFAVGDGNHSLAAAKACYEEIKAELGPDRAMTHPARYALVEVVNLYDQSLNFEPIYRVAFGVDPARMAAAFEAYADTLHGDAAPQTVRWQYGAGAHVKSGCVRIAHPVSGLAVGTVQDFLDAYIRQALPDAHIDYIHGEETVAALAEAPGALAFLYDGMAKEALFPTVLSDGALPRKTFSMGHAADKRFYTEARSIR